MHRLILIASLAIVTGCGGSSGGNRVAVHKVKGVVTFEGKPVEGATVAFSPKTPKTPSATGITDAQGTYVLTTYNYGDGAAEGTYKVKVYKIPANANAAATPAAQHDPTGKAGGKSAPPASHGSGKTSKPTGTGSVLPEKYATESTPLEKTVKAGSQEIPLDL